MEDRYLESLVEHQVIISRIEGASKIRGTLRRVDDLGIVVIYERQERGTGGFATGTMVEEEAFVPFTTIDRVLIEG